jgi:iron complex outermembrane receptor protein
LRVLSLLLAVIACSPVPVLAREEASDAMLAQLDIDITQLSIEDLLNLKITSLSKKSESASRVPAAVYVLTAEDIRRSGVTSIPEALRLVPGMEVARVDANKWAVSSRGFNSRSANKLLVMIDGRTIYDFLFSGVLWETKDVTLENVDRIEVIRGPGGAIWGANAVNGVINIITKPASETQGGLIEAAIGTEERAFGAVRYGFEAGDTGHMRVFAMGWDRDEGFLETGRPDDDARLGRGGFRYDSNPTSQDTLTVQGDAYDGRQGTPDTSIAADSTSNGGDLLGRWSRNLSGGGRVSLQFYYDTTHFDNPVLNETRHTMDLEFNHELPKLGAHSFIYGLTYRSTSDEIGNTPQLMLIPDQRTDRLQGAFVQDEIELAANQVYLTLGSKFEENDYTGSEVQPNIRLAWYTSETDMLWTAVSRAVRTPSRLEEDFVVPLPGPGHQVLRSNHMQEAEQLTAYEVGYRFSATPDLFLDLATFYNVYDDLITVEGLDGIGNKSGGETHGLEIAATWIPVQDWKFTGGYTLLDMDLELDADSLDDPATRVTALEGNDPANQIFVRMGTNFAQRYQLDVTLRYADRLPSQNVSSYTVADIRFAAHINENLELSLVGQNLFKDHHFEQGPASNGGLASEVESGVYAKLLWVF